MTFQFVWPGQSTLLMLHALLNFFFTIPWWIVVVKVKSPFYNFVVYSTDIHNIFRHEGKLKVFVWLTNQQDYLFKSLITFEGMFVFQQILMVFVELLYEIKPVPWNLRKQLNNSWAVTMLEDFFHRSDRHHQDHLSFLFYGLEACRLFRGELPVPKHINNSKRIEVTLFISSCKVPWFIMGICKRENFSPISVTHFVNLDGDPRWFG